MDGGRDQSLDLFVFQGLRRRQEGFNGILAPDLRQLTGQDGRLVFPDIVDIDLFGRDAGKILAVLVVEITVGYGLAVKIDQFVGAENQRCTQFQKTMICKGLDHQFRSDAIQITGRNSYQGSLLNAHA